MEVNRINNKMNKVIAKISLISVLLIFMVILIAYIIEDSVHTASICLFLNFLRFPCPLCGLGDSMTSILNLDFYAAWQMNIFSIPLFISMVIYAVFCTIDIIFNSNFAVKINRFLSKKIVLISIIAVILGIWIITVIRFFGRFYG